MKITIYKKQNDESVYFKINNEESSEKKLNFETIKNLSKEQLNLKQDGKSTEYTIECDSSLELYKTTLNNILKSVLDDEELFTLYKEKEEIIKEEEKNDEHENTQKTLLEEEIDE